MKDIQSEINRLEKLTLEVAYGLIQLSKALNNKKLAVHMERSTREFNSRDAMGEPDAGRDSAGA